MTTQEILAALFAQGWNDARVSVWITNEIRKQFPLDDPWASMGPSSQSVYRWRKGKSSPAMGIWIRMIEVLYEQEGKNNVVCEQD